MLRVVSKCCAVNGTWRHCTGQGQYPCRSLLFGPFQSRHVFSYRRGDCLCATSVTNKALNAALTPVAPRAFRVSRQSNRGTSSGYRYDYMQLKHEKLERYPGLVLKHYRTMLIQRTPIVDLAEDSHLQFLQLSAFLPEYCPTVVVRRG